MGAEFAKKNSDGIMELCELDDKLSKINDIMREIYSSDYYFDYWQLAQDTKTDQNILGATLFAEGHALYFVRNLGMTNNELVRNMEGYGILPMPKYDEEQEYYITTVYSDPCGIPLDVKDADMCAVILEALEAESMRIVNPVYYEVVLKDKYSHDNESARIIDLLFEHTTCDFTYMFHRNIGSGADDSPVFAIGTEHIASTYEKSMEIWGANLEKMIETLENK